MGGGQSTVPHKQSKSTAAFSPETILPCSSPLKSFHVTPWNPRNNEGKVREVWSSVQIIIAHSRSEMLLQDGYTAPFLPPLNTLCISSQGCVELHLHADNGIWLQFKGISSKVTEQACCWLRQSRMQGAHSPPLCSPDCTGRCCTAGSELPFCSGGRRIKGESKKVLSQRTAAPKTTPIR